jgi:hypothetical protein
MPLSHVKTVLARCMQEDKNKDKLEPGTSAGTSLASKHHSQKHAGQHHSEISDQQQSAAYSY